MAPELVRILLVEDEVDIQMVAQMALEDVGGFEVKVCASGAEALEEAPAFEPHLILLDFMMPGMNGTKTMSALRRLPPLQDVPVVFLTARAQLNEVAEYRREGAIEVIVKPFDPMSLADRVKEIWQQFHRASDAPDASEPEVAEQSSISQAESDAVEPDPKSGVGGNRRGRRGGLKPGHDDRGVVAYE